VFDRDTIGRVVREERSGGRGGKLTTEFVYGNQVPGLPTSTTIVKDPLDTSVQASLETHYHYNNAGRLLDEITDPNGTPHVTSHSYDANGNKLSTIDAAGNRTSFTYDGRNRLLRVDYPGGASRYFGYDSRGNKTSESDENGITKEFVYDALNRVTSKKRAAVVMAQFTYNAVNSVTGAADARGKWTLNQYDGLQRLTEVRDPLNHIIAYYYSGGSGGSVFNSSSFKPTLIIDRRGYRTEITYDAIGRPVSRRIQYEPSIYATTDFAYDKVGNLLMERDDLDHEVWHTYDALNRETVVTNADGTSRQFSYSSTGLRYLVTDERDFQTRTDYDGAGRPVQLTAPQVQGPNGIAAHPVTMTEYDGVGNITAVTNPNGHRTEYVYDGRNRKVQEIQPLAEGMVERPRLKYAYDAVGNQIAAIDARDYPTFTGYDAWNRVVTRQQPGVIATRRYSYDQAGNLLTETDELGHQTVNVYDDLNRLTSTTDSAGTIVYGYDANGNRAFITDAMGHTTLFFYDGMGRNKGSSDTVNPATTYIYNGVNKTSRVDSRGETTNYGYDVRNRLLTIAYPTRPTENRWYTYDAAGNLVTAVEPGKGGVTNVVYSYDALNRMETETSAGVTHTYRYDLAGNRTRVVFGSTNRVMDSTYDALNRLKTVTEGNRLTTYDYDAAGNITKKTLPNDDQISSVYDALNRATTIVGKTRPTIAYPDGRQLYRYRLVYDAVGNLRESSETYAEGGALGTRTLRLGYDNADRLIREEEDGSGALRTTIHTYDAGNNRISKTVQGTGGSVTTYGYNPLNQLTSVASGSSTVSFTYDANGNRGTRTRGSEVTNYAYDGENRLTSINGVDGGVSLNLQYAYDYRSRRTRRVESGTATKVVFSGGTSVQEYGANATPDTEFIRGLDRGGGVGGLLYALRAGPLSFSHYNGRGDVVAKTDGGGVLTWQAAYEGFGKRVQEWGTTADRQKANTKEEDPSGLLNEGFRYRDLETGTFITRDPAGFVDGPNLYAYVRQNPWSKFDPEGLFMFGLYDSAGDYASDVGTSLMGVGTGIYQAGRGAVVGLATTVAHLPSNTMGVINDVTELSQMDGGTVMQGVKGAAVQGGQSVSNTAAKMADTMVNGTLEAKSQLVGNGLGTAAIIAAPFARGGAVAETAAAAEVSQPGVSAARTMAQSQADAAGLETRGYKPASGERTVDGYVKQSAADGEIGLYTDSTAFDHTPGTTQFKRFGADSHAGLSPHVHQPIRNVTPNGARGTTGTKTRNGGVTKPTQRDIKQLYEHLNNGKYKE